ncbi:nucleotidyltransferase domain-containing protein [Candidatus Woesearchaeota archaeon]|nr:nucleotidyltransferase domain-containing protein [Candidatus Woesearchaeota archaeon]
MVEISLKPREREVKYHYSEADVKLAKELAHQLNKELDDLLKAVVVFGSVARGDTTKGSDIDVLLILNDLTVVLSGEVLQSIRVLIENVAGKIASNFHITQMHLSNFWDYVRQGDPVIVNMLREGMPVYDAGFFLPTQLLLDEGRIRPTKEAVWTYYDRAPKTLKNAEGHMLGALVDMYWACIDAAHAALMHVGVVPGAPSHVAELLNEHFVKKNLLDKSYINVLHQFYDLAKNIGHHQLVKMSGKDIDKYLVQARDFVKRMKFILNHSPEKLKE